jgi:hypothetical protein
MCQQTCFRRVGGDDASRRIRRGLKYLGLILQDTAWWKERRIMKRSRGIPHAWAFVGGSTSRMLLSYSPAGKMEEFFNHREQLGIQKGTYASTKDAETMRAHTRWN